ncbi:MAG: response regulator, partial [Actinomycetota bacterium]
LYNSPDAEGFDVLEFKDGRIFERYSQPQRVGGRSVGRVWSFRDLTQHRRLEDDLRQAQRMEAVGQLAGGIAHDFNNLLAVIANYAEFLEESIDVSDERRADVTEIRQAAERGAKLVRQLLTFSRKEVVQPHTLDINQVASDLEQLLGRTIGENIDLSLKRANALWPVKMDRGQVEQILMNLAVNARDAMPNGGNLEIVTTNVDADESRTRPHAFLAPGRYVRVRVADSGMGMSDEVKARLFEPFFTTKGRGEGTGLGLATVYGIVKAAAGYIHVDSAPAMGAVFDVYLPVTPEHKQSVTSKPLQPAAPAAGETILVVEDEEAVGAIVARILTRHGYEVLSASTSREAIDIFEARDGAIDLLLTDVVMPEMSGKLLAQQLQALRGGLNVLYMSGYADDIVAREGVLGEGEKLIQKPFGANDLLLKVRDVLKHERVRTARS